MGLSGAIGGLALVLAAASQPAPERGALCGPVDRAPADAAQALEPLGEAGREALLRLAQAADAADVACGLAGLTALRDPRVVAPLRAALGSAALRAEAYRFARWAAFAAGGPDPELGPAFAPLAEVLGDPAVAAATGADGIRLLGEIDHRAARDRLVAELERPAPDAAIDGLIHALARQGEPRAQSRVVALADEAVRARSGNLTYEQASRLGEATFYLLALAQDTRAEGMQLLAQLAPRDQADAAAWAAQTWCERAMRRPTEREAAVQGREALVAELDQLGVRWRDHLRGTFACAPAQ